MNISQAESAIGASVVYFGGRGDLCAGTQFRRLEVGRISHVNDKYAFVRFDGQNTAKACYPHDLTFFYGPLIKQLREMYNA